MSEKINRPKPPSDMFYVVGFDDGENLNPVAAYRTTGGPPELGVDTDWFITQRASSGRSAIDKAHEHIESGALRRMLEGI